MIWLESQYRFRSKLEIPITALESAMGLLGSQYRFRSKLRIQKSLKKAWHERSLNTASAVNLKFELIHAQPMKGKGLNTASAVNLKFTINNK